MVRASDYQILFKEIGRDNEQYRRVKWDASQFIGQQLYIQVVDNSTGGWGHINVDDINVPVLDTTPRQFCPPSKLQIWQTDCKEIIINAQDEENGSGVSQILVTLDGKPVSNPIVIRPLSLKVGSHTIQVKATDWAGNTSIQTFTLQVKMDIEYLEDLLSLAKENGFIAYQGIYNSLLAKIRHILDKKDDTQNVQNGLNALENEGFSTSG